MSVELSSNFKQYWSYVLYKDLRIRYSHNKRKLSNWNLERNCSYRITFLFHWYLGIRAGKLCPGLGILFRFFDPGTGVLLWKAVSRAGILTKKLVAREGIVTGQIDTCITWWLADFVRCSVAFLMITLKAFVPYSLKWYQIHNCSLQWNKMHSTCEKWWHSCFDLFNQFIDCHTNHFTNSSVWTKHGEGYTFSFTRALYSCFQVFLCCFSAYFQVWWWDML